MRWTTWAIPLLLVAGGVFTAAAVPIDYRIKALVVASDVFAAAAVGLVLWRRDQVGR